MGGPVAFKEELPALKEALIKAGCAWEYKKLSQIRKTLGTVANMQKERKIKNTWKWEKLPQIRSTRDATMQKTKYLIKKQQKNSQGKESW